ncbi:EF hand domain-containing protein [Toxoplasma gondii TgCatPRC2]|nr:EF hand domain-containing protein [Toxoplasma gondii ME49]EPR59333.1 EF hand domain-containing protein [Toxoplasma gondii GT1]ESS30552.1 EF hand domain-containing protein [Toxoplasma gondii VEG]KAF4643929.1 EF hand domain-containing protein [Toxoplasma gondii]KFG39802.1 EF hand domain-containing protein [Toxoplasma gondii GAB2-2007-GAL-DOM2]KFG45236.1 EF hand domain-containing protein [Toxoplasma gondii p89]KFG54662.1 EF hand domain-containing protein [Toxoplasma gondii FOU]KFH01275.1 EF |eukprot:XP_002369153.1 EF hand domain-containing protein [Toxoplasma gondii ME49]
MERKLDKYRKSLSMRPDFNLLDFWRLFDTAGKGYSTAREVEDAMSALHVHVTPHEAHLFIKQYSKAGDGKIRYVDICNAFMPKDQRYADIMQNRLPDYRQYQCMSPQKHMSTETRNLVAEVFHLLVVSEVQSESMRHQFASQNLWQTFKLLDKDNDGYITVDEFKSALRDNNVYASENEAKALLARYDTSMDGRVSYAEFVNELGVTRCPRNVCKFACTCPV